MKDKKHVAGLAKFVAIDLDVFAWRARRLLDSAHDEQSLRNGFELLAQDLEGVAAIARGAISNRIFEAAEAESARLGKNKQSKVSKTVTPEAFKNALASARRRLVAHGGSLTRGWVSQVEVDLGSSYRKVIKPRLAGWGLSQASVERYMITGEW